MLLFLLLLLMLAGTTAEPLRCAEEAAQLFPVNVELLDAAGSVLYASEDNGASFAARALISRFASETDVLPLGNGSLLAAMRYQTTDDGVNVQGWWQAGPHYKQTAVALSTDQGMSFDAPHIVTGYLQQSACLVGLRDRTIVMPFSHKDAGFGQRTLLSYDGHGAWWSNSIYELHTGGLNPGCMQALSL